MNYKLAAIFEHNMNFSGVSQGISFYNTVEEADKEGSGEVDDGGPHPATVTFMYAFPSEVAYKAFEWREGIKSLLPEGIDIIKISYKPIMDMNHNKNTWPMVDGIEIELQLGSFFRKPDTPFTNTMLRVGFFKTTVFGAEVIKQDYFYKVLDPKTQKKKITWRNIK